MKNFIHERIDDISRIDLSQVNFQSLRPHYGTGVSIRIDNAYRGKNYKYRNGIQTDLGDLAESVWLELAKWLMEKEKGQELFSQILAWTHEHNYLGGVTEKELYRHALESYIRQMPDNKEWADYIRFNAKYRSELLDELKLITVITDCCNTTCKALPEQIRKQYEGEEVIPCSICGRVSKFKIVE